MAVTIQNGIPSENALNSLSVFDARAVGLFERISGFGGDVFEVCREVRRCVYMLGLDGGPRSLHAEAYDLAVKEQRDVESMGNPVLEETQEGFRDRMRRWRTYCSVRALSFLDPRKIEEHLGDIRARVRGGAKPDRVPGLFLDSNFRLRRPVSMETPLDELIDIVAFSEAYEEGVASFEGNPRDLQNISLAAREFLIRRLVTEDSRLIDIGTRYFKLRHYLSILKSVPGALGEGRIGGKSAGMLLAYAILESKTSEFDDAFASQYGMTGEALRGKVKLSEVLEQNESYFVGSGVFDDLLANNPSSAACTTFKYNFVNGTSDEDNQAAYSEIKASILGAKFPEHIFRQLRDLFKKLHGKPIIVRSSSELEDRFGAAFAGKYESIPLANSGDFNADLKVFLQAIKRVYASVFSSEVMKYRAKNGLIPYDEEMGVLIQVLNGEQNGEFFYPALAGVAMSHATQSTGHDPSRGAMKVVHGLGDMAVDGAEGRFVMFAKPGVAVDCADRRPAQTNIAVVDLKAGGVSRVTVPELMERGCASGDSVGKVFSSRRGAYFSALSSLRWSDPSEVVISFDGLVKGGRYSQFPLIIEYVVQKLKHAFGHDVDIEFTAESLGESEYRIKLVQCRPQNIPESSKPASMPISVPEERVLLKSGNVLSCGHKEDVRYVLYIPPEVFRGNDNVQCKLGYHQVAEIQRWVARLNNQLRGEGYVIVAPGRWGSQTPEAGVQVAFGDFEDASGFFELHGQSVGMASAYEEKASFGTHFYQDVVESGMVNCGVSMSGHSSDVFNRGPFDDVDNNCVGRFPLDLPERLKPWVRVLDIEKVGQSITGSQGEWRLHVAQDNRGEDGQRVGVVYIAKKGEDLPILERVV